MLKKIENKSNSELELLRKQKHDEFYKVKEQIVALYDYWRRVELDYNSINDELNKRNFNG